MPGGRRASRRQRRLRRRAAGLRARARAARSREPEIGHLRRPASAAPPPARVPRLASSVEVGDTVTVERVRAGRRGQGHRPLEGQGLRRHHQAPQLRRGPISHGSHNVRAPGSIGQSATPSRVIKGLRMSGHMGDARVTQRGLRVLDADVERNVLLVTGAGAGPDGRRSCSCGRTSDGRRAPDRRGQGTVEPCADEAVRRARQRPAAARGRQGRAGRTPPAPHSRRRAARSRGGRAEAVAPEGHRPRPPGHDPRPAVDRRRRGLRPRAARPLAVKINRKAARKARAMALSQHAAAGTLAVFDASTSTAPQHEGRAGAARAVAQRAPGPGRASARRGTTPASRSATSRAPPWSRRRARGRRLLWARTLLVSQGALQSYA